MESLKKIFGSPFATYAVLIVLGLIFLFRPAGSMAFFVRICGIALIVYALNGFLGGEQPRPTESREKNTVIYAVSAVLGIIFLFSPGFLIRFLPALIGLCLILDSIVEIKKALDEKRKGSDGENAMMVLSVIKLIFGIIILFSPFKSAVLLMRVIGGVLIYSGIMNLYGISKSR